MCGIAGFIGWEGRDDQVANLIKNSQTSLYHRGPDAKGYWTNKNKDLIVAIHRLATQDTSPTANQPLYSQDKNVITIMNGEIYNHNYLKKILEKKGYSFKSKNDTEVIANSFHYWGKKFLNKLEGQFALFVYNMSSNLLYYYG